MRATKSRSAKRARSATKTEWSARWEAQREHLLQAAQRAIHRDGPQISMDDIAAEAGITKPILYRHFGDRRGLARAMRDTLFGLVLGAGRGDSESARKAARERVAALYPVVKDPEDFRRVVVGFATGFQMFVEMNRNLYRFLRMEGVFDRMWEESEAQVPEPVAESLAQSLRVIFADRGIDQVTAQVWAQAIRGMVTGIVDWWTESHACDRFELERQYDLLTRAMMSGLEQALSSRPRPSAGRSRRSSPAKSNGARKKAATRSRRS